MLDNIFFDVSKLKKVGKNVIIGKTVRIRYPELVEIGDNCIIDDFTYISTGLKLGDMVHISSGTKIIGGRQVTVTMGDFSTTAPNVVLAAGSDDYLDGLATPIVPTEYKGNVKFCDMSIGKHCIIGANSTIDTEVNLLEGVCIGANSFLKDTPKPYQVWGGCPARFLKNRHKDSILYYEKQFREKQHMIFDSTNKI